MSKSKKTFLRFFLCFFIFSSVVIPVRRAEAIVPLIALGVAAVTTAGITITAADVAGLAIAAAGMGALLYLKLTAPDGSAIAIPAQDAVTHPTAIIPAPAAAATAVGVATYIVGAGSQAQANTCSGGVMQYSSSDPAAACSVQACFIAANGYTGTVSVWNSATKECKAVMGTTVLNDVFWTNPPIACPAGYSGSPCVLSNARAVTQDNRQDFGRSGAAYAPVSGDLTGTIVGIQGTTNSANDSISFTGKNASGSLESVTAVALSTGGTGLIQRVNMTDSAGNTYVKTVSLGLDMDGNVIDVTQYSTNGSLTNTPSASGAATVVAPVAGAISANPTGTPAATGITFPSDYARSGEASNAANTITSTLSPRLDVIGNALTQTGTVTDPALPVAGDMPVWGNTFTNLLSWTLPGHSSACPQPSMDLTAMGLGTHTLSAHCNLLANNAAPLHSSMVLVFTVIALFIVLGA